MVTKSYDYALEGKEIIHLRCEFHIKMNIAKYERLLEKEDKEKRRKIRANIKSNEAILKAQEKHRKWWKRRFGTDWITNNAVEKFTRPAKGNLRRVVSFGKIENANSYLSLYSLHWNFHKFERGWNAGKCPLEMDGFDTKGKDWLGWLGYERYA